MDANMEKRVSKKEDGENKKKKEFRCKKCGKSYAKEYNLTVHNRTHKSDNLFKCALCLKGFDYKHVLWDHLNMIHYKELIFDCSHCDYKCHKKEDLKKHISGSHVNFLPIYPCADCGKVFKDGSNFKRHVKIVHLSEKNHACKLCDKVFSQAHNLKLHEKNIHGKENVCIVCEDSFRNGQALSMHMLTHVPRVGLNCPFCSYVLNSESDQRMKRHIREVHRPKK